MSDMLIMPKDFDEFCEQWAFNDTEEVYTNGIELVPTFRVKQWLECNKKYNLPLLRDMFVKEKSNEIEKATKEELLFLFIDYCVEITGNNEL